MDALDKVETVSPEFKEKALEWVKKLSPAVRPPELYSSLSRVFGMSVEEIKRQVDPAAIRSTDFDDLVPRHGWVKDYIDYTWNTEPPTVFHFFAAMMAMSTALSRNLYYDMGPYKLYPN